MLQIGRSLVRSQMVSLEFFIDIKSFGSHSASNRNEYQEHFLGGKGGRCVRLTTLPPSCAVVTKSVNLNFLEPSGPVQACNGIALPFTWGYTRTKLTCMCSAHKRSSEISSTRVTICKLEGQYWNRCHSKSVPLKKFEI